MAAEFSADTGAVAGAARELAAVASDVAAQPPVSAVGTGSEHVDAALRQYLDTASVSHRHFHTALVDLARDFDALVRGVAEVERNLAGGVPSANPARGKRG